MSAASNDDEDRESLYLHVHLGRLKGPWRDHCKRIGKTPGRALKEMVEQTLRESEERKTQPAATLQESTDEGPKTRVELRFTPSEKRKLDEVAQAEGCSIQNWVVNVVRATVTKQPHLGVREIQALGESNYQLLAIGRNLNQIAKRLNERAETPDRAVLDQLGELRRVISEHTEQATRAIRASLERWRMD